MAPHIGWRVLGRQRPSGNESRRAAAMRALQRLWVAGAMGAFFFALISSIPRDVRRIAWPPDLMTTLHGVLSYGYLLWLLAYFFVAALNEEEASDDPSRSDLIFDVVQGGISFAAAYLLGFIIADHSYERAGFVFSNFAVVVICGLGLWLYGARDRRSKSGVNRLRWLGLAGGGLGMVAFHVTSDVRITYVLLLISLAVIWGMLIAYIRIRVDEAPG